MPALLYFYCLVAALIPNVVLAITEPLCVWARIANIILPLGVYMLLLSWSRRIGRTVWCFFPILFIAAFQIVLLKLYGKSVIAVDMFLNLVTTNPSEAGELLGSLIGIVAADIGVYGSLLVWGGIAWKKKHQLSKHFQKITARTGGMVTILGLATLGASYATDRSYSVEDDLYPVNAFYNLFLATERTSDIAAYHTTSADFCSHAHYVRDSTENELLIMVVGETSRAENWQLCGYDRPTNPRLSGREGLVSFDRTMSQSNTTHKSVPMLLSDLTASTFSDSISKHKGIITTFREAGYETAFISNQGRNHSYIDFFGNEADEVLFLRDSLSTVEMMHPITDFSILPHLSDRLKRSRGNKNLIVIHTYGSHFSYIDRYPECCRHFLPDSYTRSEAKQRTELLNAYDNSIVATDLLIDSIISLADQLGIPAAVIYTSDHGEDIFDDSRNRFLHASPTPTFHQINVPLLVWTSPEFRELHPEIYDALEANRHMRVASSESYYQTALQLGGIVATTSDRSASLASENFKERPRIYLTDHNESVPLTESGFDRRDLELLIKFDR